MTKAAIAAFAVFMLGAALPERAEARPGGCLKYGLGGAIAGHFAGGHRWKGAAAGCALGYYQRRRHETAERARMRDRDRGDYTRDIERPRSVDRDRAYGADDRRRYDPEETGTLRRRTPGTDF
jgi:hypothetical protein